MKNRKRTLIWSAALILLPMVYGALVYQQLPQQMATHWSVNNEVNGYMARPFMIFGLPLLMLVMQLVILFVPRGKQAAPRFERVAVATIPVVTLVMYITTIQYNLGHRLDIWHIAVLLMAALFIAMGNYMPTVPEGYDYGWHPYNRMFKGARRRQYLQLFGFVMVGGGIALLISLFFSGLVSAIVMGIIIVLLVVGPLLLLLKRV